jgi:polynucleotide 5'-hydroxyl-kinase GRC3/NOL9
MNEEKTLKFSAGCHSFYGKMRARVLSGIATVNGFVMDNKNTYKYLFYSPCHSLPIQFTSIGEYTLLVSPIPDSDIPKETLTFYHPKNNFVELAKGCYFSSSFKQVEYPDDVISIVDEKTKKNSVFFVVGEKGSGKSHFARFLTNHLLNKYKIVNFVDIDPGQPEHVLPHTLGTTYIDSPIFHPPEVQRPYRQSVFFYGDITVNGTNVDRYIRVILNCRDSIISGFPMVINSLGYISGLGYDTHVAISKELRPNLTIVMEINPVGIFPTAPRIKVVPIKCSQSINPQKHRTLRFVEQIKRNSLVSVQQPKKIDIRKVYFCLPMKIDPAEVFSFAVGNIAFMSSCRVSHQVKSSSQDAPVKVTFDVQPREIFGVCLIRAVDTENFTLYVNTPYSVNKATILFITTEFIKTLVADHPVYPSFCQIEIPEYLKSI